MACRVLFLLLFATTAGAEERLTLPGGEVLRYTLVTNPQDSAHGTALQLLRHLAEGNLEAAARLSNAPKRRYEELRDYRDSVGEDEFKRVFARYFAPTNRLLAEAAIGRRRLLIWDLGEARNHLAGQFFVEAEGGFLLDDVPSEARAKLQRVLEAYRKKTTN